MKNIQRLTSLSLIAVAALCCSLPAQADNQSNRTYKLHFSGKIVSDSRPATGTRVVVDLHTTSSEQHLTATALVNGDGTYSIGMTLQEKPANSFEYKVTLRGPWIEETMVDGSQILQSSRRIEVSQSMDLEGRYVPLALLK